MSEHNGKYNGNGHDPGDRPPDNVVRMPTLAERDRLRREQRQGAASPHAAAGDEPAINLPPATKYLALVLLLPQIVIHLLLDAPAQFAVYETLGFTPAAYTVDFAPLPALAGPFAYSFIHGSWLHFAMNIVMLVAFGAGVEKWMGGKRMIALFMLSALAACAFHFILSPFSAHSMVGASGGVSGLFAAVLVMLHRQGRLPAGRYGLLPLAALWVGISFVFGMMGGPDGSAIAWAAHIGGFLAGFALIGPVLRTRFLS